MTNESEQARQSTNNLRDKLIQDELRQVTKFDRKVVLSLRQKNDTAFIDIFNKKRKCCNHRYQSHPPAVMK